LSETSGQLTNSISSPKKGGSTEVLVISSAIWIEGWNPQTNEPHREFLSSQGESAQSIKAIESRERNHKWGDQRENKRTENL